MLRGVRSFAGRLTAVIAVTDTGRSTGLARAIGRIPAPGDLRATIAAFATDPLVARLLQHRLSGAGLPQLEGMAFGNLLLAVLAEVQGDFGAAVATTARWAGASAEVLPVALADTQLCAELADGHLVEGELAVRGLDKPPIARLFLREPAAAHAPALEAIRAADLVVVGPGSLFTTVLACLLFEGLPEALRETRGQVVYVCNTTTQPGQSDGLRALDHVARVVDLLGPGVLDTALINRSTPDPAMLEAYERQGLHLLRPDEAEIAAVARLGVRPLLRDLTEVPGQQRALWNKLDTIRHDPEALGAALRELIDTQSG